MLPWVWLPLRWLCGYSVRLTYLNKLVYIPCWSCGGPVIHTQKYLSDKCPHCGKREPARRGETTIYSISRLCRELSYVALVVAVIVVLVWVLHAVQILD